MYYYSQIKLLKGKFFSFAKTFLPAKSKKTGNMSGRKVGKRVIT